MVIGTSYHQTATVKGRGRQSFRVNNPETSEPKREEKKCHLHYKWNALTVTVE